MINIIYSLLIELHCFHALAVDRFSLSECCLNVCHCKPGEQGAGFFCWCQGESLGTYKDHSRETWLQAQRCFGRIPEVLLFFLTEDAQDSTGAVRLQLCNSGSI